MRIMQRERWNFIIKLTVAPLLIASLLIANPAAALAQSPLEVQSSNATTDQYADGSDQQAPAGPDDPALNQQAPAGPDDPALNQQVPSGSPNAQASSEYDNQAEIAFLQATIPILQGLVDQAQTSQVAPSNAGYMVVGGGTLAPQQPVAVIDPLASLASGGPLDVGPSNLSQPPLAPLIGQGDLDVGKPTSPPDLLLHALEQGLASSLPQGQTAVQKQFYDRGKDGLREDGGTDYSELDPSGEADPTGTKDDYTGR